MLDLSFTAQLLKFIHQMDTVLPALLYYLLMLTSEILEAHMKAVFRMKSFKTNTDFFTEQDGTVNTT